MAVLKTLKRNALASIALSTLVISGLTTATAEAKWSAPRCLTQCSKTYLGNSDTKLNNCATNCDNTKLIDMLYPNYYKLNPSNLEHFLDALKYQQSLKNKEQINNEDMLQAELHKPAKKQSKSKVTKLHNENNRLASEINALGVKIQKISAHHDIVHGKKGTPSKDDKEELIKDLDDVPTHAQAATQAHNAAQMKAEEASTHVDHPSSSIRATKKLPPIPSKKGEIKLEEPNNLPPTDMPPEFPHEHAPMKAHVPQPPTGMTMAEMKAHVDNRRAELKAEGKGPADVSRILREEAEARKAGKAITPSVVNPSGPTNDPSPEVGGMTGSKSGGTPAHLAGLGENPLAALKKVPKDQIQDKSAALGAGTIRESGASTASSPSQASSDAPKSTGNPLLDEIHKVAAAREKRLSQSGGIPPQAEALPQYNLTADEKITIKRRMGIHGDEEAKKEIEASLAKAKAAQIKLDIAKFSAQLAYVEENMD